MNPTIVLSLTCKTTLEHRARTKYIPVDFTWARSLKTS